MKRGNNEKHEKQSEIVSFLPTRRDWDDSTRMLQSGGLGIEKYGNGEKKEKLKMVCDKLERINEHCTHTHTHIIMVGSSGSVHFLILSR